MTALYSEIEKSSVGPSEEHLIEAAAVITHFLDDANAPVRAKTIRPMLRDFQLIRSSTRCS